MLFPLDAIAVLVYLLTLDRSAADAAAGPAALGVAAGAAGLILLGMLTGWGGRWWLSRRSPGRRAEPAGAIRLFMRVATVLVYVTVMEESAWPTAATVGLGLPLRTSFQAAVGLLPYFLYCILVWLTQYPLHRLVAPGEWTRRSYLLHQIRYNFYIFGVWLPFILIFELIDPAGAGGLAEPGPLGRLASYGLLLFLGWTFPYFLRFFWGCRRLPDGPLRERIAEISGRAGVGFSELYAWDLGGGALINAAAVGLLPPFRYLFVSRALLRSLPPEEVDAVVAHELAHVKHGHVLFYIVFTVGMMELLQSGLAALPLSAHEQAVAFLAALAVHIRFIFAYCSRRLERQADLGALTWLGTAESLCQGLERIAYLSGDVRAVPSWHHLSVAERVGFLRAAQERPELAAAHHWQTARLMAGGYLLAAVSLTAGWLTPETPTPAAAESARSPAAAPAELEAHWRLTRWLLPESPRPALELARLSLAAGRPDSARQLAETAKNLARTREERAAVEELSASLDRPAEKP